VAGYGASGSYVPDPINHAIKMLIAHLYENRELFLQTGAVPKELPLTFRSLCAPFRIMEW